jgi:pimeloyl-ACP methyl ester carboxylesterase
MAALVSDVLALAERAGLDRFDVVGHDWGAAVAWNLAAHHGDRVRSVTALSVPHPGAMAQAARHLDQARRSWYMAAFQLPVVPERLLGARNADGFRRQLEHSGLSATPAGRYAQRARNSAMTGPLNWYRALPFDARRNVPAVRVPALYVWGDRDAFVSPRAAGACGQWMAGPARCEILRGVSHWLPEMAPGPTAELLQQHLGNVED